MDAINDVLTDVHSVKLRDILRDSTYEHEKLLEATKALLASFGDEGKKPKTMAKAMSHIKTSMKMMKEDVDKSVADLITDGCNMGIKSAKRYLNQYCATDEGIKDVANKLIDIEKDLLVKMEEFL